MAFASPRVSRVEHGLSLLPSLEERWCLDLYPALNVPASSTASRPGRLSLSRHYRRSVGKDHRTRRHLRIRCAQARERPQAPYFGGHPRAADRMQSGASRHLRPKGGCPVARWPESHYSRTFAHSSLMPDTKVASSRATCCARTAGSCRSSNVGSARSRSQASPGLWSAASSGLAEIDD